MDFIFRRCDGSHVSVDTVHPSLLRSSSFSSTRWYHLESRSSDVFLVSPLYLAKRPQSCFPVPLCNVLYFQSLPDVIVSHMVSFSVWPHAHLHIFISVTSSFFTWELVTGTVSVQYSIAGWTNMLCIFPSTCGGTLLSHRTPDIFLQLFHPHCVLMFISVLLSPSLCRVLPRYLNYVTCGSWEDCILTLPNCIPFRHMYSVFALDTFTPLFSKASLHCSSSNSSTYFSLAHSTTSSANIISHGASFLVFSVSESIMIASRKGLKAVLGGGQLPLQMVRLFLQHTALQFRFDGTCPSPV